jgi:DNA invertase Pin-like site-specific DNA recombinase
MLVKYYSFMTSAPTTIRAGCYCRISSDPKDKREGVGRQREDTTALCEIKGWTPSAFYVDNDRSASNGKQRPEWDRLLADIEAGEIDAIAAWDQDRGWRMMHELEDLRRFFTTLGRHVPLATTGQGDIDLYSPTGVLTAQIKTAVSEHEIAMMSVRMRRALRQRAEEGRPRWTQAFGYLNMGGDRRESDPRTAPLVKQAYAAVLAGSSIADIARMFNDAEECGLNGRPWTRASVSTFLRAPRNAGLRAYNGEIIGKAAWPPLVDETAWRAAQFVLGAPSRRSGRKSVRRHTMTGVMLCGREGCSGYLGAQRAARLGELLYVCTSCHRLGIRARFVDPMILEWVSERLAMPDAIDLLRAELHDEAEAETLRLETNTLLAEIDQLAVDRVEGLLTSRQVQIGTTLIEQKLAAIEARQADQERVRVFDGLPLGTPEVVDAVKRLSPDRYRAVIDVLMTITVAPVGKGGRAFNPKRVQITWK